MKVLFLQTIKEIHKNKKNTIWTTDEYDVHEFRVPQTDPVAKLHNNRISKQNPNPNYGGGSLFMS